MGVDHNYSNWYCSEGTFVGDLTRYATVDFDVTCSIPKVINVNLYSITLFDWKSKPRRLFENDYHTHVFKPGSDVFPQEPPEPTP